MKSKKETAFFPGKFHPPHLGHILTIKKILKKYRRVIVCVSAHIPDEPVTTPKKIYELLQIFFEDNKRVDVMFLDETLVEKDNLLGLPKFDILLSGNEDVLDWAKEHNIKAIHTPRSEGIFCSGTEIRESLNNEL